MSEVKKPQIADHVIFNDADRKDHNALVTTVWPSGMPDSQDGVNLIIVSGDENRDDQYGRQTEHHTSIVHQSTQPAGGYCWRWPDEE